MAGELQESQGQDHAVLLEALAQWRAREGGEGEAVQALAQATADHPKGLINLGSIRLTQLIYVIAKLPLDPVCRKAMQSLAEETCHRRQWNVRFLGLAIQDLARFPKLWRSADVLRRGLWRAFRLRSMA